MKIGKLIRVGNSLAAVIPMPALNRLGWYHGDQIVQEVVDDKIVLTNLNRRGLKFVSTKAEYGDAIGRRS